jgi:GT2 family glycosyltransferase
VIVVDDGNELPLDAVVESYTDELDVTLVSQRHAGPAMARNTGARRARGRFLAFTDDDCAPSVDWLHALADRLMARPDCAVGGQTLNLLVDNLCSTASQMLVGYLYTYYNAAPDRARFLTSNNLAVPADLFFALGGFDTAYTRTAAEDRELCDRWRQYGHPLLYAPEAVVYHAHALTLRTFWRQHFTYGIGAYQFHRARAERATGRFRIEPANFYAGIIRYPFTQSQGVAAGSLLTGLLILSQVANATGFLWEWTQAAFGRGDRS